MELLKENASEIHGYTSIVACIATEEATDQNLYCENGDTLPTVALP